MFLLENPPRIEQFKVKRRNGRTPSGTIVVHCSESPWKRGAHWLARFIRDRTTYGSYHDVCDWADVVRMMPYSYEAFGSGPVNNFSYHVCGAFSVKEWNGIPADTRNNYIKNMAKASADYAKWLEKNYGIRVPGKLISRAEALAGKPGFIGHGMVEPTRRSDPGKDFPWSDFLAEYNRLMGNDIPKPQTGGKAWPHIALPVADKHTTASHNAWVKLLSDIGYTDSSLTKNIQQWLAKKNLYRGRIDGVFGSMTVRALQSFLKGKGLYKGVVDGQRGPLTIRAEIDYLNSQRKFY